MNTVETKQKYPQSGLFRRIIGFFIDLLTLSVLWVFLVGHSFAISANWSYVPKRGLISDVVYLNPQYALYFLLALIVYFVIAESMWSSTLGKLITGQKVVGINKQKAPFVKVFIRNILKCVDIIIGVPAILLSKKNQTLGDRVAGTVVVRKKLLDLSLVDKRVTLVRKAFAGLFILLLVAMIGMLCFVTIPKVKELDVVGKSVLKVAQEKVASNDTSGLYQLLVPEYQQQISYEEFTKKAASTRLSELVQSINIEKLKFYVLKFNDTRASFQGTDGVSFVELNIAQQKNGDWKIIAVTIDNPTIK